MITNLFTSEYSVRFSYRKDKTQAMIVDNFDGYVVGFGAVTRHPSDTPNRVTGEKYALTAALENSTLNRTERTEIWRKFHGL